MLGAYLGAVIGLLLYGVCFGQTNSTILAVVIALIFVVIFAYLTYRFYDHIIILATSLIGSYSLVRGFCWPFDAFPNELEIWTAIKNDMSVL